MTKTYPTVSVVIPIYNDEQYIDDCLLALRQQTIAPLEILVIDNNCTDNSITIAKTFFNVKIIQEKQQGLCYARNTGLSAAKGDILLRIDADTILPKEFIHTLQEISLEHPDVSGFTGYGISRFEIIPKLSTVWSWMYFTYTHAVFGHSMLWGANMAIRRSAWHKLHNSLILNNEIHEDQDVSLALTSVGGKILIDKRLTVSVQMETILNFNKFHKYVVMMKNLKQLDRKHARHEYAQRLPKTALWVRASYWIASAWSVYVFYLVTIMYTSVSSFSKQLTARLSLAGRFQDL